MSYTWRNRRSSPSDPSDSTLTTKSRLRLPVDHPSRTTFHSPQSLFTHSGGGFGSDGLHPNEQDLLDHYAERFGIDLSTLPDVPEDLTEVPWATRLLVYRDAVILALADEHVSGEEREYLAELAERMKISAQIADSISIWAKDCEALLERLEALIGG